MPEFAYLRCVRLFLASVRYQLTQAYPNELSEAMTSFVGKAV
jgi:hypothetical protein